MYADVGFRAIAEVLEHHRDKWLTVTTGRAFNTYSEGPSGSLWRSRRALVGLQGCTTGGRKRVTVLPFHRD